MNVTEEEKDNESIHGVKYDDTIKSNFRQESFSELSDTQKS